jgi:NADH-quinone oxidoreductase subunit N
MMEALISQKDLLYIMPEIVVTLFGLFILLLEAFYYKDRSKEPLAGICVIGSLIALIYTFNQWGITKELFYGLYTIDSFGTLFKAIFLIIITLVGLVSLRYMEREGLSSGEYYSLLLFAGHGMMIMVSTNNFITIFIGLEVMSLSIYILCGLFRENLKSAEASLKYFLLGAFATAFFLYGIALIYGQAGTLDIRGLARFVNDKASFTPIFITGIALLIVGFGFKTALVPFHMWTPDVYEGAPTSVTAFMATGVKAAAFITFLRVFYTAFIPFIKEWGEILWFIAVLTMTVGNIVALVQDNIKRMLAYSSIAHAGYILVAFVTGERLLASSIIYYLIVYTFMNIGAFTCVILLGRKGEENVDIESYAGLAGRHPFIALSMTIFMFSLTGVPPLAGFMAKFYVFSTAIKAGYTWLAIIGILNSVIAAYYYLRVVMFMYFREPTKEIGKIEIAPAYILVILISIWAVIHMGIFPRDFLLMAMDTVSIFI